MSATSSPHDTLVRALLADRRFAAQILRVALPAEIAALIDADRLELLEGSFVDASLNRSQSDALFRLPLLTGENLPRFCFRKPRSCRRNQTWGGFAPRGIALGEARGEARGRVAAIARVLATRFGPLDARVMLRLRTLPAAALDTLLDRAVTADSLDAVFAPH
jgi:hypothetical protein